MFKLIMTDSDHPDFRALVTLLDARLKDIDGEEDHAFYAQFNKIDKIRHAVVAYDGNQAVGIGAIKQYDAQSAEVKRMFVLPEYRGRGVAKAVLKELESWAKELGFTSCILETGKRMPDAVGLYLGQGYTVTPNFGQYINDENSVCMAKEV